MENFSKYPADERPLVGVFSPPDLLGISLIENLLANLFRIKIFTAQEEKWNEILSHISNKESLEIISSNKNFKDPEMKYALFNFLNEDKDFHSSFNIAADFAIKSGIKTLGLYSYNHKTLLNYPISLSDNLGIIYLGDFLSPRMELNGPSETSRIISEAIKKKKVKIYKDRIIFPISAASTATLIVKWLFSFGPYGEEVVVTSSGISEWNFFEKIKRYLPETTFLLEEEKEKRLVTRSIKKNILTTNIDGLLKDVFDWFFIRQKMSKKTIETGKKEEENLTHPLKPTLIFILLLFISPIIFLLISSASLVLAENFLLKSNFTLGDKCLALAKGTAYLSNGESKILFQLPLVGQAYKTPLLYSDIAMRISDAGFTARALGEDIKGLSEKILGDEVYDPNAFSTKINIEAGNLYREISFLQNDINSQGGIGKKLTAKFLSGVDLNRVEEYLIAIKTVSGELPTLLGKDTQTTYLVLLQNNMELRPTGGFIGSFALVTFSGGRLVDINVSDVYSADGQLRGHVEPPPPIKDYLGEANWYLRDANWDPDFPTSAAKIEWFLDKEIDKKVDGVMAIDLDFIKALLTQTGPIKLTDFNETINEQNLYEITQTQVENNFFPGSYQKTNFMTALSREILTRVTNLQGSEYLGVSRATLSSLENKHIQIFLHNSNVQESLANLGWDGGAREIECSNNCFPDWLGTVEANVGVNKANYYLRRGFDLSISLTDKAVQKTLSVNYQNSANPSLGTSGIYKTFLRLLVPTSAENISAKLVSGETSEEIPLKLGGYYFEVSPGQNKTFVLSWQENVGYDFGKTGEYRFFWRKQAGTLEDRVSMRFYLPEGVIVQTQPTPSLTSDGNFGYNTVLSRDFGSRILWYTPTPTGGSNLK